MFNENKIDFHQFIKCLKQQLTFEKECCKIYNSLKEFRKFEWLFLELQLKTSEKYSYDFLECKGNIQM